MTARCEIMVVIGTRPEAIKLAPVIRACRERELHVAVCVTAQHRELLDDALEAFGVLPDFDLDLMTHGQGLSALTARILGRLEEVFQSRRPRIIVVQGDTTTAVTAALSGYYAGIPVAHVEAGLRTHHLSDPWPEEANRRIIARLAELHFAPTDHAAGNLVGEGVPNDRVHVTGNTVIDALEATERRDCGISEDSVLVTCHRRHRQGYAHVTSVLDAVADAFPDREFVLPLHPRPRLRDALIDALEHRANFRLIDALPYPCMLDAVRRCATVVTDSGGVQEEAAWFGTPCVVLRERTDRPESVESGHTIVGGFDARTAVDALARSLDRGRLPASMAFGDGSASTLIAEHLDAWLRDDLR